ncbi:MAG: DUF6496 domain-containing protein [Burkholderiaceae bacterium]
MDGFKNTTKTNYTTVAGRKFARGGEMVSRNDTVGGEAPMNKPAMVAKYAKGGHVTKGDKKIGRVMTEFTEGKLHSGSKEGPKVKSTKQAVAIALNEARAAGAKIPRVQKAGGGRIDRSMMESTSSRPTIKGRPMSDEELSTPERILRQSGRADPYEKMPKSGPAADTFRRDHGLEVTKTTVREVPANKRGPAFSAEPMFKAGRKVLGMMGLKKGGLAVMPRGKKGC